MPSAEVRAMAPGEQHIGVDPRPSGYPACAAGAGREDGGRMSTRMLLILAAITGVAILAAGAIQILLAR